MSGWRLLGSVWGALFFAAVACGQPPEMEWEFDVVRAKSGAEFRGLIQEETNGRIKFLCVRRVPGRPTICFPTTFTPSEIDQVRRLDGPARARLNARIKALYAAEKIEPTRLRQVQLTKTAWRGKADSALAYQSDAFTLQSDAPEEIVRRAAVRLEQVFAAFQRFLPPTRPIERPVSIMVFRTRAGYSELLRDERRTLTNPGFYDPGTGRIVCASDLERLGDDLDTVGKQHSRLLAELDCNEAALRKLYRGKELLRHLQAIRDTRAKVQKVEKQNEAIFDAASRRLFATLYHEAFHAYIDHALLTPGSAGLPPWLNEGLAQLFETAIIEAGELRLGHAESERLDRAKKLFHQGQLPSVAEMLRSGVREFQPGHDLTRESADRHYLAAWALAHHLTFDRRVVNTTSLQTLIAAYAADPAQSFQDLVGIDLIEYERSFHHYLAGLQSDGAVVELSGRNRP